MKVIFTLFASFWILMIPASGWAILLSEPELQPFANQDPEVAAEVRAEMKKLSFRSGIIHVGAPQPTRFLKFDSPGQSLNTLLPLLQKLGMKVTLSFSDVENPPEGFGMAQKEDGSKELGVTIYTRHKEFEFTKLRVVMNGGSEKKREKDSQFVQPE